MTSDELGEKGDGRDGGISSAKIIGEESRKVKGERRRAEAAWQGVGDWGWRMEDGRW